MGEGEWERENWSTSCTHGGSWTFEWCKRKRTISNQPFFHSDFSVQIFISPEKSYYMKDKIHDRRWTRETAFLTSICNFAPVFRRAYRVTESPKASFEKKKRIKWVLVDFIEYPDHDPEVAVSHNPAKSTDTNSLRYINALYFVHSVHNIFCKNRDELLAHQLMLLNPVARKFFQTLSFIWFTGTVCYNLYQATNSFNCKLFTHDRVMQVLETSKAPPKVIHTYNCTHVRCKYARIDNWSSSSDSFWSTDSPQHLYVPVQIIRLPCFSWSGQFHLNGHLVSSSFITQTLITPAASLLQTILIQGGPVIKIYLYLNVICNCAGSDSLRIS